MKKNLRIQLLLFLVVVMMFSAMFGAFAYSGSLRTPAPRGALTGRGETVATATAATPAAGTTATPTTTTPTSATPTTATATPTEPVSSGVPSAAAKTQNGFTYVVSNGQAVIIAVDASVKGDVTVPDELGGAPVGVIGMGAFKGNEGIVSVVLPDSVAQIDEQAFKGCPSLEKLSLGKSLTALPESAVEDCGKLTEIAFSDQNRHFVIDASGAVYNAARTELITVTHDIAGEYTVPAAVASVRSGAFRGCAKLTKVVFAGADTVIGEGAFRDCAALTDVTLPENLKTVPAEAFSGCAALTEAVLPSSVEIIGERAFAGCAKLNGSLPGGLKTLGDGAFADCAALTAIVLPDGCADIGKGVFAGCTALANVSLPEGAAAIPDRMFENCVALQNVERADAVETVGERAFYGCAALAEVGNYTLFTRVGLDAFTGTKWFNDFEGGALNGKNLLLLYKPSAGEKKMTVGENITAIAPGAFRGCATLEEINLPGGLLFIGASAFENCAALKSIFIPVGVTEIGANAFRNCAALEIVDYTGVARIGENAFEGTPIAIGAEAERSDFYLGMNLVRASIAYPEKASPTDAKKAPRRDAATATDPDSTMTTGTVPAGSTATDAAAATKTDGAKATGTDAAAATKTDAQATGTDTEPVTVPAEGQTGSFEGIVYTVSNGVRSIASGAFRGAEEIEQLVLPEGLKILSDGAFAGLVNLKRVNIPTTVTYGDNAFDDMRGDVAVCSHEATVQRYEDVKKCESPWFAGCTYCADCAALLDRGALKAPTGHRFVRTAGNGDSVLLTCDVCKATKTITAAEYAVVLTDSDKAKVEDSYVIVTGGLTAAQLLKQCPAGAVILDGKNDQVVGDASVGSGMTALFPNSRRYTAVLYGDADGDGDISPADARIALRRSVKLDETLTWRDKACHVIKDGETEVSSEDARLILRAAVGLEDASVFGNIVPVQPDPPSTTEPTTQPTTVPTTQPTTAPAPTYRAGTYICTSSSGVYLRVYHSVDHSAMDIINSGELVTVKEVFCDTSTGKRVYWGKITHRGVTGWAQLEYFVAV